MGFYTEENTQSARRSYGVCEYKDNTYGLHMISAMMIVNNDVVGGVPIIHVKRIDNWNDSHYLKINMSPTP